MSNILKIFKNEEEKNKNIILFFASIVSAFVAYSFMYYNVGFVSDTLGVYTNGIHGDISISWNLGLGRWVRALLDYVFDILGYSAVIPFVSLIISSTIIAISNFILWTTIKINSFKYKLIWAIIIPVIPAMIEMMRFFTDVPFFSLCFILSNISLYYFSRKKYVLAILYMTLSSAMYQPFFTYTVSLFVVLLITDYLNIDELSVKNFCLDISCIFLISVVSLIMYAIGLTLCMHLLGISFGSMGQRMTGVNATNILHNALKLYGIAILMPFRNYAGANTTFVAKVAWLVLYLLAIVTIIKLLKTKTRMVKIGVCLLLLILPICMNAIVFFQQVTTGRMLFAFYLILLLFIVLADIYETTIISKIENKKGINLSKVTAIALILLWSYFIFQANGTGYTAYNITQATKVYAIELAQSIRNTPGYSTKNKVFFAGTFTDANIEDYYVYADYEKFPLAVVYPNIFLSDWVFEKGIKRLAAFNYQSPNEKEKKNILETKTFKDMPIYPNYGSIKLINDVMVIKFSNH